MGHVGVKGQWGKCLRIGGPNADECPALGNGKCANGCGHGY